MSQQPSSKNLFLVHRQPRNSTLEKQRQNRYMEGNKECLWPALTRPMIGGNATHRRSRHSSSSQLEAYGHLPQEFRQLTTDLIIEVADFPSDDVFEDMALETPFDLLGLFEGRGISERFTMETGEFPNRDHPLPPPDHRLLGGKRGDAGRHHHPCADPRDRPPFRPLRRRHGTDRGERGARRRLTLHLPIIARWKPLIRSGPSPRRRGEGNSRYASESEHDQFQKAGLTRRL